MKNFDCVEEYIIKNNMVITLYRARIYSKFLNCMVDISGNKGLHKTKQAAYQYAKNWINGAI